MCGIFGFYGTDQNRLERMAHLMRMRGPDDVSYYVDEHVSLGMVRLAIVDKSKGQQPFVSEDGNIIVFYNGEIYNWKELRLPGHTYKTECDGEVIPHLYEEYGDQFVHYLRGMYAICVYRKDIGEYTLYRDPAGVKPLYGSLGEFASTTHSMLKRKICYGCIDIYSAFGNTLESIYRSPCAINRAPSEVVSSKGLEREFCDAVKIRMVADRVPGLFLSGGLDSTTVLNEMVIHADPSLINTFTLCYTDSIPGKDADRAMAAKMAKYYRTTHHEVCISSDDVWDALPDIARAFDQPFAGCISTWFLAKEAKKTVDCVLTGDGADELFGSYLIHRIAAQHPTVPISRWRKGFLGKVDNHKLIDGILSQIDYTEGADALEKLLKWEWANTFQCGVLAFSDTLSMAHALEIRSPFVDKFVVAEAFAIPSSEKINHGSTKIALHNLATQIGVPAQVICRAKEGFVQPSLYWLKTKWKDRVLAIDSVPIRDVAKEYYAGREDLGMDLWREINLHIWQEVCDV